MTSNILHMQACTTNTLLMFYIKPIRLNQPRTHARTHTHTHIGPTICSHIALVVVLKLAVWTIMDLTHLLARLVIRNMRVKPRRVASILVNQLIHSDIKQGSITLKNLAPHPLLTGLQKYFFLLLYGVKKVDDILRLPGHLSVPTSIILSVPTTEHC